MNVNNLLIIPVAFSLISCTENLIEKKIECNQEDICVALYEVSTDATVSFVNELYIFKKQNLSSKKIIFRSDKSKNISFNFSKDIDIFFSDARFFIKENTVNFDKKVFKVNYVKINR